MLKIAFVCLGNICRSPMAEFVMKDLVRAQGLEKDFFIFSAGTAGYHNGEDMHFKTKNKLKEKCIKARGFKSQKLSAKMCKESDFLITMDESNYHFVSILCQKSGVNAKKILRLCDFLPAHFDYKEVPDPWYSGDFDETYEIVKPACENLLEKLKKDLEKDLKEGFFKGILKNKIKALALFLGVSPLI